MSAALSVVAIDENFESYGSSVTWSWLWTIAALTLAASVTYWSLYMSLGISRTLQPERTSIPWSVPGPRRLLWLVTNTRGVPVPYPKLPSAWHSGWATTIHRLRFVALLVLYVIAQFFANRTGAAHGSLSLMTYVEDIVILTVLASVVPVVLVDITRRRLADDPTANAPEVTARPWLRPGVSLLIAVGYLAFAAVVLIGRFNSVLDHPVRLHGDGAMVVALAASTQTIYVGCGDDLNCAPLTVSEIHVVDEHNHHVVPVLADVGVDHESFFEHPWLSVANVTLPRQGHYRITLDAKPGGQYVLSLSQVEFLHVLAPLILTLLLRLTGVGLAIAPLSDLARRQRRRAPPRIASRDSLVHHLTWSPQRTSATVARSQ